MGKKILVTSTDLMMIQFLVPHVRNLIAHGFELDIACSEVGGRIAEIRNKLKGEVGNIYNVRLVRSPAKMSNAIGFRDLKRIISRTHYDYIWTNEPVMGIMTRLAAISARRHGTKVTYMVHGFHFFKGAPLLSWILYYPIEYAATHLCDQIVTINREDRERAKRMNGAPVKYIHGIGVDTDRLETADKGSDIREEMGLSLDSFLILSVGELMQRKNHQVMIRALGKIKDSSIHYLICGVGEKEKELRILAENRGIGDRVHFLGYRRDVANLYRQVDIFAFPSRREGLGIAALEAMYCGLPLITSDTSGPRDYMENGKTGYMCDPDDVNGFAAAIYRLRRSKKLRISCGDYNREVVKPFCLDEAKRKVLALFKN